MFMDFVFYVQGSPNYWEFLEAIICLIFTGAEFNFERAVVCVMKVCYNFYNLQKRDIIFMTEIDGPIIFMGSKLNNVSKFRSFNFLRWFLPINAGFYHVFSLWPNIGSANRFYAVRTETQ